MIDEGHRQLAEKLTKTQDMLRSAMTVIGHFRPLTTAVRENLSACPAAVVSAYEGVADMVSDAEAEAHSARDRGLSAGRIAMRWIVSNIDGTLSVVEADTGRCIAHGAKDTGMRYREAVEIANAHNRAHGFEDVPDDDGAADE